MDSGALAPPGPTVPGIGRRVLSMLYESLIVFAVAFFAGLAFYGATHGRLSGNGGRTLPMQTWKMRVVRPDNLPIGVGRAALRYVLAWPSLLLFGVGVFWAFFDRDRQFLHDRLAGTRIVATGDAGAGHR